MFYINYHHYDVTLNKYVQCYLVIYIKTVFKRILSNLNKANKCKYPLWDLYRYFMKSSGRYGSHGGRYVNPQPTRVGAGVKNQY